MPLARKSEEMDGVYRRKSPCKGKIAEKKLLPGEEKTFKAAFRRGEDGNAGVEPAGDGDSGLVREEWEEQLRLVTEPRSRPEIRLERRGVGETQPSEQAGKGMVGRVEASQSVTEQRPRAIDRHALEEMKKTQEELTTRGLGRPLAQLDDPGEERLRLARPALFPAKQGKRPKKERLLVDPIEEEGGAIEEGFRLLASTAKPLEGRKEAVGGPQVTSRDVDVQSGLCLLDGEKSQNLGEIRLLRERRKSGLPNIAKEDRHPEGRPCEDGISARFRVEREKLREKDVGVLDRGVEVWKSETEAIKHRGGAIGQSWFGDGRPSFWQLPGWHEELLEQESVRVAVKSFGHGLRPHRLLEER
jgi:hypothetical protein